jgi:hypothetical protein
MFVPTVILSAAMAATPPTPIDRVTVEQAADSAQLFGFDADGQVAIELSVWFAEDEPRVAAALPSGGYIVVGTAGILDSHDYDSVKAQMVELGEAFLDVDVDTEQATWFECGLAAAGAVSGVVAVNPWCIGSAILAACECVPLMIEEFEDMNCPLLD